MRIVYLLVAYCVAVPILAAVLMRYDTSRQGATVRLLNVSFDPTRELWRSINSAFQERYEKETGAKVAISQSHGGSASQATAVTVGLPADVVTLALWHDTDVLAPELIHKDWEKRLPNHSVPYTSTIVFVVRKGNPKQIHDWPDLIRSDVQVITPNPMTSGNGKLSFLAAWGAVKAKGGSDAAALAFVSELYRHVPILAQGARSAATTFAQNCQGDVHLTWENEAYLEVQESRGSLEVVYPSVSIVAEPPVALVDAVVDRRETRRQAEAYLNFLFTPEGQDIIARHYFRPIDPEVLKQHRDKFRDIPLFEITTVAKDWGDAQMRFFSTNGIYNQIQAQFNAGQ